MGRLHEFNRSICRAAFASANNPLNHGRPAFVVLVKIIMNIRKILTAHDFSPPADRALRFAAELAARLGAELHVVHVLPSVNATSTDPGGRPWSTPDQADRYQRFMEQELERATTAVLGSSSLPVNQHVTPGDPIERIEALAKELGADLICLGSTGKGAVQRALLGTVSQRVVRSSVVPVLTVH